MAIGEHGWAHVEASFTAQYLDAFTAADHACAFFDGRADVTKHALTTAEARLVGPDGTLYAHATTTCLVFELKSGLNTTPT